MNVCLGSLRIRMALDQGPNFSSHPLDSAGVGGGAAFQTFLPHCSEIITMHSDYCLLLCFIHTGNDIDSGGLSVR